jgi:hypothetical protein
MNPCARAKAVRLHARSDAISIALAPSEIWLETPA